ncbi:MAG: CHAT domain-containing protein [Anaerolineae bacterium]|nr:CHAT domain-containing protein [Anaerolineae bacterium]
MASDNGMWETYERRLHDPMATAILQADRLLALAPETATAQLNDVQQAMDIAALQRLRQVLTVRHAQASLADPDGGERLATAQTLLATAEETLAARASLAPMVSAPSLEKQEAWLHLMEDFNAAMAAHSPANAAATLARVLLLHDRAGELLASPPADYLKDDLVSLMCDTLAAAADYARELGDAAAARRFLQQAVDTADRHLALDAAALRLKLADFLLSRSGDFDQALQDLLPLRESMDDQPASLARVQLTLLLAEGYARIGDDFETARAIRDAAADLQTLGYSAPETATLTASLGAWIAAADRQTRTPNEFRGALLAATRSYMTIANLRYQIESDSQAGAAALALTEALTGLGMELMRRDQEIAEQDYRVLVTMAPAPDEVAPFGAISFGYEAQLKNLIDRLSGLQARIEREKASDALLEEASRLLEEGRELNAGRIVSLLLNMHAAVLHGLGRDAEAISDWREVWTRSLAAGEPGDALDAQQQIIALYLERADHAAVSRLCGEAIDLIERDRYNVSPPYLQSAFLRRKVQFYFLGVFAAYKLGDIDLMLRRAELSKSRITAHRGDVQASTLAGEIRQLTRDLETVPVGDEAALRQKRRTLWDLLAIQHAADRQPAPPQFSLAAVQAALAPDEVVVSYYWLHPGVLLVTAIDCGDVATTRQVFGDDYPQLEVLVDQLGELRGPRPVEHVLDSFARYLLPEEIRPLLHGKLRVIFSPHRLLHRFPLHALPWEDNVLIARLAVSYAPSLTSLLVARPVASGTRVLAVGADQYAIPGRTITPLPGVAREIRDLHRAYTAHGVVTDLLTGPSASVETLRSWAGDNRLRDYRVLHFATHGEDVLGDSPMETALLFYDAELDGLELSTWSLEADLAVLSACHTAKRALTGPGMAELVGDDLFGLQASLFSAGARSVVGALWKADDDAAVQIMQILHSQVAAGVAPEFALQAAVNGYLAGATGDWRRNLYFWAPYVLSVFGRVPRSLPGAVN